MYGETSNGLLGVPQGSLKRASEQSLVNVEVVCREITCVVRMIESDVQITGLEYGIVDVDFTSIDFATEIQKVDVHIDYSDA